MTAAYPKCCYNEWLTKRLHCTLFIPAFFGPSKGISTGGIIGLTIGLLAFLGIVFGAFGCIYIWRNRDKEYANKVTQRAGKTLLVMVLVHVAY
ncbi:MAG: hypothetical protein AB2693_31925 [Candidatus Thiodiazotropha sp.]